MTNTIRSAHDMNDIINAIANLSVSAMQSLYRTASQYLIANDDDSQADINDDAKWWAGDIVSEKNWNAVQNASSAALMTVRVVTTVRGHLVKKATTLHTSPETLGWSQMGGDHIIDARAGDAWLQVNIPALA